MEIPGYDIGTTLADGPSFAIFRARRAADGAPVQIKTAATGVADPTTVGGRLKWEYQITRSLAVDGVLAVHDLIPHEPAAALIFADTDAIVLRRLLDENRLSPESAVAVALGIVSVLAAIHQQGVAHMALHPSNVLVHPETGRVTLTGLDAASRLAEDDLQAGHPTVLPEMVAYLAPEQTGRLNQRVGYQADLYSCGVMLYEMLVGRVPFDSGDPMEVIHAHIALEPESPADLRDDLPRSLSDIVLMLLAKATEDRYQSARGVHADLVTYRDGAAGDGFVPGLQDVPDRIRAPNTLYGRADEITQLMDAFNRVSDGGAELLLVSGYSGIGKSALVQEVRTPIVQRHGHFISGKFDQYKQNIPHSAIIAAFQELTRQLLTESDPQVAAWRHRLQEALGENGQVIVGVIPEIELIVGPQRPVPTLPPAEARNRFNLLFERFIKVFTREDHPLVVFLDDLQWADAATLDLLRALASDPTLRFLLIIGAYRDNEVGERHPLAQAVLDVDATTTAVSRIQLAALNFEDLHRLITDTLRCTADDAMPLAALIHEKTEGNPFFVIQFITLLEREHLLVFDHAVGAWRADVPAMRALGITDNVVELMVRKIEQLPQATQSVVKLAACIGNRFDLHTLAIASQVSHGRAAADLRDAVREGLVLPLSEVGVRLAELDDRAEGEDPGTATYRFLHDRVQQAAYSLIPDDHKQDVHVRVGRLMWQHSDEAALEDQLFEIVRHLNTGAGLLDDPAERLSLVELNLQAGRKAKTATAYDAALRYFETGIDQLPSNAWSAHYDLAFGFHLERAECTYLCGAFDRAEHQLEDLLDRARSPLQKAEIYRLRIVEHENRSRFAEARDWGKTGLALFGIIFPDDPDARQAMLEAEIDEIDQLVGSADIESLVDLPVMSDEAMRVSMKLLMTMWAPSYISGDMLLTVLVATKMVYLSLRFGNVEESAYGYVTYAATVRLQRGDYVGNLAFGRLALAVNERFDDLTARAKVNHMFSCYIGFWRAPIASCFPYSREAYRAGLASGDFIYAAYGAYHESWHALFAGQPLTEYHDQYSPYLAFLTRTKNKAFFQAHQQILHVGLALQGQTEHPWSMTSDAFDEAVYLNTYGPLGFFGSIYYVCKLQLLYLFGQYDEALTTATLAADVAGKTGGMIWDAWRCFYQVLTLLAGFPTLPIEAREQAEQGIATLTNRMRDWAEHSPTNFGHRYALVVAEAAALRGDTAAAVHAYERAIAESAEHGFLQVEALANERYGRFWLDRGNQRLATIYLDAARDRYTAWGALAKVSDLQTRYAAQLARQAADTIRPDADAFDLKTVVRAAQAISGEVEQRALLGALLHKVIETAGAQKGLLLLNRDGQLLIEAEGTATAEEVVVLQAAPAESSGRLASSVVRYVTRVGESVVLGDARRDSRFAKDPYIQEHKPISLLCTPILHQGTAVALLYLENNLVRDAFTEERAEVVGILASQAAISLTNARLYDGLKVEVGERKLAEAALRQALDEVEQLKTRLQAENLYLQEEIRGVHNFTEIVGNSPPLLEALEHIERVAPTDSTVLIVGETGSGKELIARAVHDRSPRRHRPLVKVNCGAIAPGLIESELFGHVKGAFTSALDKRVGRFELANLGTIFLDEVSELPAEAQVKLLRVLQEREFEPVGSSRTIRVDIRVIAATNRDLDQAVKEGAFRADLLYRLNVFPISVPPLRERVSDIPLLAGFFLSALARKLGKPIQGCSAESLSRMMRYGWPGNIRELQNVLERAAILARGPVVEVETGLTSDPPVTDAPTSSPPASDTLDDVLRRHILAVLKTTGGVVEGTRGAATILGLHPNTLRSRMKKLGISTSSNTPS